MILKISVVFFIVMLCMTGCASGSAVSVNPERSGESYSSAPDSAAKLNGGFTDETSSQYEESKLLKDNKGEAKKAADGRRDEKAKKKPKASVEDPSFLANPAKYTTNGAYYQEKHKDSLLSIADRLTKSGMKIVPGSIGFYHDKRTDAFKGLYLGLDILVENVSGKDYGERAKSAIFSYLKQTIETIDDYHEIFTEDEIVGTAISFRWKSGGASETVNIWILEPEVESYRNDGMTFEEVVQRSYVTNEQGRIMVFN